MEFFSYLKNKNFGEIECLIKGWKHQWKGIISMLQELKHRWNIIKTKTQEMKHWWDCEKDAMMKLNAFNTKTLEDW